MVNRIFGQSPRILRDSAPLSRGLRNTLPPEYPRELLCNGRDPDQVFTPDENLYYRVENFDIQGKVPVEQIRCPDTSVNRGKYSQPKHVLYAQIPKYLGHKVAVLKVREIPA